jgi:hypothetical protein
LELLGSFLLLHALGAIEEFVEDATKLRKSRPGDRSLWGLVCAMGRDLDPENPLFAVPGVNHRSFGRTNLHLVTALSTRSNR